MGGDTGKGAELRTMGDEKSAGKEGQRGHETDWRVSKVEGTEMGIGTPTHEKTLLPHVSQPVNKAQCHHFPVN